MGVTSTSDKEMRRDLRRMANRAAYRQVRQHVMEIVAAADPLVVGELNKRFRELRLSGLIPKNVNYIDWVAEQLAMRNAVARPPIDANAS